MDYFDEIFEAYKHRGYSERSFEEMAWSKEMAKPGELGLELNSTERRSRYDCIKQWTHLHVKVRVVGVFDTGKFSLALLEQSAWLTRSSW